MNVQEQWRVDAQTSNRENTSVRSAAENRLFLGAPGVLAFAPAVAQNKALALESFQEECYEGKRPHPSGCIGLLGRGFGCWVN